VQEEIDNLNINSFS